MSVYRLETGYASWTPSVALSEGGGQPRQRAGRPRAEAAEGVPAGAEGLVCLPYFAGERTPIHDPDTRGVFAGLTLSHTRAHLYRAILEGTAYGVRHNIETLRDMGAAPERVVAVGGSASNRLWLQIVSDVADMAQIVPERTVGTSYGDAFLAGLATGIIPDLSALVVDWVQVAEVREPRPETECQYDAYYNIYQSLYEHARDDLHVLARLGNLNVP